MIIIFGAATKVATERPLIDTHCYTCGRVTTWVLYRATEWLTGFFIPVLPIKTDRFLACAGCKDHLQLTKDEIRDVQRRSDMTPAESTDLHDRLVGRLEAQQLSGKTETQREYLKNRRH